MPRVTGLIKIRFKGKEYAYHEKRRMVYDLEFYRNGILKKIGYLTESLRHNPIFVRENNSPSHSQFNISKDIVQNKLNKINLNKKKKLDDTYLQYMDEIYAPEGPGYKKIKSRFKRNQQSQKKHSRARSFTRSKRKSRSTNRRKTIGGRKLSR